MSPELEDESMPVRRFRCPDEVWLPAMVKARGEGTTVSAKLRGWLIRYVHEGDPGDL